jgi:hypothetical protein
MEYWSIGVLDEYGPEVHGSCFSADRNMLICPIQGIWEKQNQGGANKIF